MIVSEKSATFSGPRPETRWAEPKDAGDLALLLSEIAAHYKQEPLAPDAVLAAAREWLKNERPAHRHFALAFVDGVPAGLASVALAHPGVDLKRLLFLKELFVRDGFRSAGIGRALLAFLARHCMAKGIGRIDLTTENWNEGAIRFYEQLGAARLEQKVFLRFDTEQLRDLAEEGEA